MATRRRQTRRRQKWRDWHKDAQLGDIVRPALSFRDEFRQLVGINIGDRRVGEAAHHANHDAGGVEPSRRGPRENMLFNDSVVATTDLVHSLIGRHDWQAITLALVFWGWGPRGCGTWLGSPEPDPLKRTEVDDRAATGALRAFKERVRNTYRRTVGRRAASKRRNRSAAKRIKPAVNI